MIEFFLVVGFGLFMLCKSVYNDHVRNTHAFTDAELNKMNLEMVGKSKRECRQIVKRYSK